MTKSKLTVDQLIEELTLIRSKYGDVEICCFSMEDDYDKQYDFFSVEISSHFNGDEKRVFFNMYSQ
jgi:hypothetical protein